MTTQRAGVGAHRSHALRTVAIAMAVAGGYYLGARLGFVLRFPPATTSVIWPPNAFLTAVLLLTPPRRWWIYLLAAFPAHVLVALQAGFTTPFILAVFLTNCAEALLAASFVHGFSDAPTRFDTLHRMIVFVLGPVILAQVLSGSADAAVVTWFRGEPYWMVWGRRLLSNSLSTLTLVPALVTVVSQGGRWLRTSQPRRRLEAALLTVALVSIAGTIFAGPWESGHLPGVPYTSLPFLMPCLVWAALRFGPGGASLSLLATALLAIGSALSGRRPFAILSPEESVVALQVFITVVGIPLLLLSALLEERRQSALALEERLRFEELLSRLSAAFVHLPSDKMDEAFGVWLRRLGEFLGVDRVELRQFSRDAQDLTIVYSWPASGPPVFPPVLARADIPWAAARLLGEQTLSFGSLDELPAEAAREKELLREYGLRSKLSLPLVGSGVVHGALCFATVSERSWPDSLVKRWRLAADVLASALARKQTEDALRGSEAMKSAVLSSLTSNVAVLDYEGRIVAVNQSWTDLDRAYPMISGGVVGTVGTNYLDGWRAKASGGSTDAKAAVAGIHGVLDGSLPSYSLEYACPASAVERWYLMTVVPLRAPEGGAVVSLSDVTERRRVEADAQRSRQELAHYLRVSTIGELTTSLAHELNQPLTAILANAQAARKLLEGRASDRRELREILADIVEEDKRAGEVIRRLRELLRKGEAERAPLDVNGLVRDVVKLLGSDTVIRGLSVRMELEAEPITVHGDRVQIQQVILNLLINAMDAMAESDHDRVIVVRTERTGEGTARIAVEDNGPGLGDDLKDRVFEPFFTTKGSGMGMGLPIARSIVAAHGGTMSAANNPERGATFSVALPLAGGIPA